MKKRKERDGGRVRRKVKPRMEETYLIAMLKEIQRHMVEKGVFDRTGILHIAIDRGYISFFSFDEEETKTLDYYEFTEKKE